MSTTTPTNGHAKSLVERLDADAKEARAEAAELKAKLHDAENRTRWAWQDAAKAEVGEHLLRTCDLLGERIAHAVQDQNAELIDDLAHVLREVWEVRWGMDLGNEHVAWNEPEPEQQPPAG